jgi:hypothetical protein|tara:strand:- start:2432 stop:3763 length:1332 start_codon:yes stop_codon:yes gene_type:complete
MCVAEKDSEKFEELAEVARRKEAAEDEQRRITEDMKRKWLSNTTLEDHTTLEKKFAEDFRLTLSDAKQELRYNLKKFEIEGNDIPKTIKELKKYRRTLKGEEKSKITNSIENLIKAYSDHLDKSMDSIYWIRKYKPVLKDMTCSEDNLIKLSYVNDETTRRELIDVLCKYWEARVEKDGMPFNSEYSKLTKTMTNSKREFKRILKKHMKTTSQKEILKQQITTIVCEESGISARQIHERLPESMFKKTTPSIIAKMAKQSNITNVEGSFYKFSDEIKKDIYAYTAAFIDSDGYITMDKKYNPRVGLVATGDRGKAFMMEMHKSLGCGRLHLDQKSPQDTRPVNRLNFYSADDVTEILTKCRPHFKMKGANADILLELIRMKKSHKKADWFSDRRHELFKLMKYENHKDHVGYDFTRYDIDIDTVAKLHDNCKMAEMDRLEGVI